MTEEFLHHVWKFKLFDLTDLKTSCGQTIEIIKAGTHNFDSGPDFFNAKVRIGTTVWAGNVEVHINASDWKKHRHQYDKAYDNIILHVVNKADEKLYRSSGEEIPAIEIKERIDPVLLTKYMEFKMAPHPVPCASQISTIPSIILNSTIDKMIFERLEKKADTITSSLARNKNNWEESFYQLIARSFGFKTNSDPFELLAKATPSVILAKHKNSLHQLEAILYGQAGMLNEHFNDPYPVSLQNEYIFLKNKFKLEQMDKHLWKFLRLRPANFPTIRIAQFASLVEKSSGLFSAVLQSESVESVKNQFDVSVSEYWKEHYVFDKSSKKTEKPLGDEAIYSIMSNVIVPFLFVFGKERSEQKYIDRAIYFLENIRAEKNSVTDSWKSVGISAKSAYQSQALLQLKNEYCLNKRCLSCNVGNYLLKNS
jgi:hypothetical protein